MSLIEALDELDGAVADGRFVGYLKRRIPDELDAYPRRVVETYLTAESGDSDLLLCLSEFSGSVLSAYAERQACLAVRLRSEESLEHSVIGLGLSLVLSHDEREQLLVMPLPINSARLLGVDAAALFERCAWRLPPKARATLLAFIQRGPENRTLEGMGYIETTDADGVRYERSW